MTKNSSEQAYVYYAKGNEQGNTDATTRIALAHENETLKPIKKDFKQCLNYLKLAIEKDDNPIAENHLGSLYYTGKIVKENFKLSTEHFERAAKQGNLDAMNNIGICYELGHGVAKSIDKAVEYYKTASEKNHPQAIANHGILLIKTNRENNSKVKFKYFKIQRLILKQKDSFSEHCI
jgi:TPR repeat protein